MGSIVCSRRHKRKNKVVVEVLLDQDEYRQLRGEIDDVRLFSDRAPGVPSRVSLRGRNEATKYFLIPRQLRKRMAIHGRVSCQRIQGADGKDIFVYVVDPAARGDRVSIDW